MLGKARPTYPAHGRQQRRAKLELVDAHVPPVAGEYAVVVVHGEHEPAGKGVAVEHGNGGHGERQEPVEQGVQRVLGEARRADGQVQVQAVGVKLGDGRRRDHHARRARLEQLDLVERAQHGAAEGRRQPVVRRRGEGQEVDLGRRLRADDLAADVVLERRDGHGEESLGRHRER